MIVGYTSLLHILLKKYIYIYMSDWASITFYIEIRSSQHDRDVDTRNPGAMDIRPHSPPELWDDLVYLIKKFQLRMQIWFWYMALSENVAPPKSSTGCGTITFAIKTNILCHVQGIAIFRRTQIHPNHSFKICFIPHVSSLCFMLI